MSFKLVAFDLDGTLLDTMPIYYEVIYNATKQVFDDTVDDIAFRKSFHKNSTLGGFLQDYNQQDTTALRQKIGKILDEQLPKYFLQGVSWMPTAKQTLLQLKTQYPIGIVTGSFRHIVDIYNEITGLYAMVDTILTRTELGQQKKPNPNGLLQLQNQFGIHPNHCIYIGNDDEDLETAHNAGWKGVLLQDERLSKSAIDNADYVVDTLEEILTIL